MSLLLLHACLFLIRKLDNGGRDRIEGCTASTSHSFLSLFNCNESLLHEQQFRIVELDDIHQHYRHHNDFDLNDADFRQPHTPKKGKQLFSVAAI